MLDGGLGTHMQNIGLDIENKELWQSHWIRKSPRICQLIHTLYYESGADIVTTASFNANLNELMKFYKFKFESQAEDLIARSVELAHGARVYV